MNFQTLVFFKGGKAISVDWGLFSAVEFNEAVTLAFGYCKGSRKMTFSPE